MIDFYDSSKITILKKKLNIYRVFFYLTLALFVIEVVVFSILIEYKNKGLIQPLMISISLVITVILVFLFLYLIYPNKWMINRIELMNRSYKHEDKGTIDSFKDNVTLRKNIVGKEITFIVNEKPSVFFLEDNDVDFNLEVGKEYIVFTYDNFIISLKESIDE